MNFARVLYIYENQYLSIINEEKKFEFKGINSDEYLAK